MKAFQLISSNSLVLSFATNSCGQQQKSAFQKEETPNSQVLSEHCLTITQVKKPWYGLRFLVIKKFKESIPEYAAIKGLVYKAYHFNENRSFFGGIYVWKTENNAKTWFNQTWFDRTESTYGVRGNVDYYKVSKMETLVEIKVPNASYWAALVMEEKEIDAKADGLLKIFSISSYNGQKGFISMWENEAKCKAYFKKNNQKALFFDTPVLLNNQK